LARVSPADSEAPLEFLTLGPIAVRRDGQELPLGGPKQRALLALLLVHENQVVSRDRLIDGLWGERPPPTAAHTLFNLVDKRHAHATTAVTSNIALSDWGRYLGDTTVAMAILDRLAMNAIRIDISGPSYRQHLGELRAHKHGPEKAAPPVAAEP